MVARAALLSLSSAWQFASANSASGAVGLSGALLTSARNEVIAPFTTLSDLRESDARDQIGLLIATDVLSEGVDLRDASVVVHVERCCT